MSFTKANIFGFDFISASSVDEVAAAIVEETLTSQKVAFLITPNAYQVVHYSDKDNRSLKEFYSRSAYILPDGMPIVWLSKVKETQLQSRLTGSDLFPAMWARIKQQNIPVSLVLPSADVAGRFEQEYDRCSSIVPKFFSADESDYIDQLAKDVAGQIIDNNSRFVFLGLGFPKQELLGIAIEEQLRKKNYQQGVLILLLGASFEFYFGMKKRAPAFFRKTGLEWLYRFMQEPGRLWKRYTVDNAKFILLGIGELFKPKK